MVGEVWRKTYTRTTLKSSEWGVVALPQKKEGARLVEKHSWFWALQQQQQQEQQQQEQQQQEQQQTKTTQQRGSACARAVSIQILSPVRRARADPLLVVVVVVVVQAEIDRHFHGRILLEFPSRRRWNSTKKVWLSFPPRTGSTSPSKSHFA